MIISKEYNMLEDFIMNGNIKTFVTKKQAQEYAKSIGWKIYNVERIQRKYEMIWIVAQHFITPEVIGNCKFDVYNSPVGYKRDQSDNVMKMETVRFKKLIS
jgi:hypothetical protein